MLFPAGFVYTDRLAEACVECKPVKTGRREIMYRANVWVNVLHGSEQHATALAATLSFFGV